ncbi:MAG: hypothetical protein EOO08_04470 [Chitinophagaceae bacterium]|nr:MAG: hypothetical protein EOO08_04470 [Chitinophagaceae bacterium]
MRRLAQQPFYCFLLPAFFVLHGYVQNYGLLPAAEALRLLVLYSVASVVLLLLVSKLLASHRKAGMLVFLLLGVELFYGAVTDKLHSLAPNLPNSPIVGFAFVILMVSVGARWLVRGREPGSIAGFLNLLLLLLLLVDGSGWWKRHSMRDGEQHGRAWPMVESRGQRPDVFLVVADEYAGSKQLSDLLHFDNTPFLDSLRSRGFQVDDNARSNYNYTEYSVASLLNGAYFPAASRTNATDVGRCFSWIRANETVRFFQREGYAMHNLSIFDMDAAPSPAPRTWNDQWNDILRQQTFTQRVYRALAGPKKDPATFEEVNNALLRETDALLTQKAERPRFVYTHLLLPHSPYFRDSAGRPTATARMQDRFDSSAYVEYLQYGNTVYLRLMDRILAQSKRPTVIFFFGDHGFRGLRQKVAQEYYFMNLSAVYASPGLVKEWPKGAGMVNQFRLLLNSCFGQNLSMLHDERHFIGEQAH